MHISRELFYSGVAYCLTMLVLFPILYLVAGVDGEPRNFSECVYFSLVTATTTGYGDIAPQGSGRLIAGFQMLITMAYIAFVLPAAVSVTLRQSDT